MLCGIFDSQQNVRAELTMLMLHRKFWSLKNPGTTTGPGLATLRIAQPCFAADIVIDQALKYVNTLYSSQGRSRAIRRAVGARFGPLLLIGDIVVAEKS